MKAPRPNLRSRRSDCPISFSLDLLGDRWTLLIVRDAVFEGKRTFGQFLASEEGIATNILSDRLSRLVCAGILRHRPGPGREDRGAYQLTEKGIDLVPVLLDLVVWGAKYDPRTAAPPEFVAQAVHHREQLLAAIAAGLRGTGAPVAARGGEEAGGTGVPVKSGPKRRRR